MMDRRDRGRYSMERDRRGGQARSRSRDRNDRMRGRDSNRYGKRKEEKKDKFVGSLSEGQKPDKDTTSESDYGDAPDPVYDDEDDEEKIIEMRRKKREELLKKLAKTTDARPTNAPKAKPISPAVDNDDCIILETEKPSNGKDRPKISAAKEPPPIIKPPPIVKQPPPKVPIAATPTKVEQTPPESTTPPLPPGHFNKFGPAAAEEVNPQAIKSKETKKNDWDMFAEQDCDSNFDVSLQISLNISRK